jgi:hypothetical protein
MAGIYASAPLQLRRPSRIVYGHCFDRALYRGFERRLTPGIEWGEKRGRHAIAAFERGAWDFAVSHCLERSVEASTTISKLKSFDIACRSHLPTQRTPVGAFAAVVLVLAAIWELNAVYDWQVPNRQLPDPEQFPSPRVQSHYVEQRQELLWRHSAGS